MCNLILVGFSYTGKSRVGEACAASLGWSFMDTDALVERDAGQSVAAIFAKQGEVLFRDMESRALRHACDRRDAVIATGGGAVITPGNREMMRRSGVVICLEARPETILRRLEREHSLRGASDPVRPLLQGTDPLLRIATLKEHRQVFYALADWTVHTDYLSIAQVVKETLRGFKTVQRARAKSGAAEV